MKPSLQIAIVAVVLSGAANATDLVILTSSQAVSDALRHELRLEAEQGDDPAYWLSGALQTGRFDRPYRLVVARVPALDAGAGTTAAELLERFDPRYLVLLDTATAIGDKLTVGDVAVGRLVWEFSVDDSSIKPLYDLQFRADGALVNASLTVTSEWRDLADNARSPKMDAGALAAGPWDATRGVALEAQIRRANGRSIAVLPGAAHLSRSVEIAQAQGRAVGMITIAGIAASPSEVPAHERAPAAVRNAVLFTVALLHETWPVAPR